MTDIKHPCGLERLSGSPGCVICDNDGSNPRSLKLAIFWDEKERSVRIPCVPDESWCGYSAIVHGGVVASVLDEAMAWVVRQESGDWAFTADCHLRFKRPVQPGKRYEAVAAVEQLASRKITVQARFLDENGNAVVEAQAIFLPAKGRALPRE